MKSLKISESSKDNGGDGKKRLIYLPRLNQKTMKISMLTKVIN
jgi:hypothetical protein